MCSSCSDNEVDSVIQIWLAGSCDREGGRTAENRGKKRKIKQMTLKIQQLQDLLDIDSDE
jgi:hypothetical protein